MADARSIVITGAGSGIGRATARRFLAAGWRVAALGRTEGPLRDTVRGAPALILPCDVTDEAAVDAAFARCHAEWGRLDALFNNAGRGARPATPDDLDADTFRDVIAVNVTGMFLCARAAFRLMRAQAPQGGRIVNNGSIAAHAPRPGSVAYTTSKHAVTGLTKSLSLDGRPFGIACGQIDIGNAATDLLAQVSAGSPDAEPLMDVAVVADAVLHMAGLPIGANVQFMTVMATNMPFIGRG
ncbi:SDR family oxidoreductase [Paracoccus sediminis]|uniref:NADP-dependent 3-hydroxy acid dehydrogenase YdfG n=1 Tax=Paracoccus sediminis TaxID=1214787 RepID=A0A238UY85_9RHOB|nr:SDR family oxidoreductase [Paracoccus sediminis]TBN52648.1 SDR family oxidoreductase [Paracoccus sediminis]SNR26966.1 NADP-dependent 3-hydroxy acid dehydrogenase YdfG [Paracoccus sediminis]